jgi:ClpP class serine protease
MLTSGPYKAFGGTREGMIRQVELSKYSFLQAVQIGRGDRLKVDLAYLSRAEIYTGVQALEMGLVDGLQSTHESVERAAELAGLRRYQAVELYPLAFADEMGGAVGHYQPPPVDAHRVWAPPQDLPPGIYQRYIVAPAHR